MPELPEVETIARTLAPQIMGWLVCSATVLLPKTLQWGQEKLPLVPGRRISRVFRRAKLLMLELDAPPGADGPPLIMAFHLKMTGRFFVYPADAAPQKHTRLILDMVSPVSGTQSRLFFDDARTFGYCRVMAPEELPLWPFWASLGPEPLETPVQTLAARFAGRRAAVKAVLLDQSVVAGVGNIYADEALFRAGIAPLAKASDIAPARLEGLAKALQEVLWQSIEECGSSIRDYRDAMGNAGAFQNSFAVYGRKGEACGLCGTALACGRVAGRTTMHCPTCQK